VTREARWTASSRSDLGHGAPKFINSIFRHASQSPAVNQHHAGKEEGLPAASKQFSMFDIVDFVWVALLSYQGNGSSKY